MSEITTVGIDLAKLGLTRLLWTVHIHKSGSNRCTTASTSLPNSMDTPVDASIDTPSVCARCRHLLMEDLLPILRMKTLRTHHSIRA
jgi:hypothetical protein